MKAGSPRGGVNRGSRASTGARGSSRWLRSAAARRQRCTISRTLSPAAVAAIVTTSSERVQPSSGSGSTPTTVGKPPSVRPTSTSAASRQPTASAARRATPSSSSSIPTGMRSITGAEPASDRLESSTATGGSMVRLRPLPSRRHEKRAPSACASTESIDASANLAFASCSSSPKSRAMALFRPWGRPSDGTTANGKRRLARVSS